MERSERRLSGASALSDDGASSSKRRLSHRYSASDFALNSAPPHGHADDTEMGTVKPGAEHLEPLLAVPGPGEGRSRFKLELEEPEQWTSAAVGRRRLLNLRQWRPRPRVLLFLLPVLAAVMLISDYSKHGEFTFWEWGDRIGAATAAETGTGLRYSAGLAYPDEVLGNVSPHPIAQLIERGRQKKREMDELVQAVKGGGVEAAAQNYREAFGLNPPEGFEVWYEYAKSISSTPVPSLLPFAHTSVLPYLALPPQLLQDRVPPLEVERGVFGISFHPENASLTYTNDNDEVTHYMSPRGDLPLVFQPIMHLLPPSQQPERPVHLTVCVKDGSCRLSSGRIMQQSREKARRGEVWAKEELEQLEHDQRQPRGWMQTCPPRPEGKEAPFADTARRSFVYDLEEAMDFCSHPELPALNGEMIMEDQHIMRHLAPMLAVSRLSHGADLVGVPTRAVNDTNEHEPWASKSRAQAVWRGTLTGVFLRDRWDWASGQRARLTMLGAERANGTRVEVLVGPAAEGVASGGMGGEEGGGTRTRKYSKGELVQRWLDVGVIEKDFKPMCGIGPTGEACRIDGDHELEVLVDCDDKHEHACDDVQRTMPFVESMTNLEALPYKYRMDIDGYGWSSRFRKVLSSNTLILKSTVYPEWWTAQAIPWYHLVPMKYDYADVFDIMAYFDGAPDAAADADAGGGASDTAGGGGAAGSGEEEGGRAGPGGETPPPTRGRDDQARMIARQGRKFALEQLRWEDMQSYMLLFLLEYRRAWSFDRDQASYGGKMTLS